MNLIKAIARLRSLDTTTKPRVRVALLGALAAAALVAVAGPARATYPGANGRLAFGLTLSGGAQPDVYSLLPNGDSLKQLTRDHSLLSDALLERPELTESDLAYLPRNVITRALGIAPSDAGARKLLERARAGLR